MFAVCELSFINSMEAAMSTQAATDLAPADFNGRCAILAGQIVAATSCPADVARMAANSFHSYRNAPDHGFGDASGDLVTRLKWSSARVALADWKAARTGAAQAYRVAA